MNCSSVRQSTLEWSQKQCLRFDAASLEPMAQNPTKTWIIVDNQYWSADWRRVISGS
jgi:hypothetical protein